jgi:hypothetical protein
MKISDIAFFAQVVESESTLIDDATSITTFSVLVMNKQEETVLEVDIARKVKTKIVKEGIIRGVSTDMVRCRFADKRYSFFALYDFALEATRIDRENGALIGFSQEAYQYLVELSGELAEVFS